MFYSPELERGWIVHPIFASDALVMQTLAEMDQHPSAPGFSDIGIRNLLYCYCVSMKPRRVLEIGTHIGFGAIVIASALRLNQYGRLYTVEPNEQARQLANRYLEKSNLLDYVKVIPGFSYEERCQQQLKESAPFEIIFLDAAHDFDSAAHDIRLCAELITENGIIILHDTGIRSPEMDPSGRGGVRTALNIFVSSHPQFRAIYFEYPLWLNPCGAAILCRQRLDPPLSEDPVF
jgi:predicted O-methyltransferase YrrM